jgi:pimeloyl-ACP methyl ester carboxylesterase
MSLLVLVEGTEMAIWRPFPVLQPSEQNTYADIEAAYKCLEESYGTKQEDIILYGQSVGSGPTLDLAARLPQLRAVVLHSPILSGLRVMYPVKRTYWFDIYKVTCVYQYSCPNQSLKWWFYNLYNIMSLFFVLFFFAEYWQNPTSKLSSSHHACNCNACWSVYKAFFCSFIIAYFGKSIAKFVSMFVSQYNWCWNCSICFLLYVLLSSHLQFFLLLKNLKCSLYS